MRRLPSSFKFMVFLSAMFFATATDAFVERTKEFNPATMGWRATELNSLTNTAPENFAADIQKYRDAGGKGDPAALLNLAVLHQRGFGLTTNLEEAARLVTQAAEMGFAPAQTQLGLYLGEGIGVPRDKVKAVSWYEKAAAQNFATAEYLLGYCYLYGQGVATNFDTANEWLRKAAKHDSPAGLHALAYSHYIGRGVATNRTEAIRLLRRATELGSYPSATFLAIILLEDSNSADLGEAVRLARSAAENGDISGQRLLAKMFLLGRGVPFDTKQALHWMRRAAGRGDFEADAILGRWHLGDIFGKPDYATALFWLEPAAKAGHPLAQNSLGMMYANGWGVPTDHWKGVELFRLAAAQSFADGWTSLALMYYMGSGFARDEREGFRCARRAAELGSPHGQRMVAYAWLTGSGTPTNFDEGVKWMSRAAAQGEPDAINQLESWIRERRFSAERMAESTALLKSVADKGSLPAAMVVGRFYASGILQPRSFARAWDYCSRAATNRFPNAAARVTLMLIEESRGPDDEPPQAWKWLEDTANQGDAQAQAGLAMRYISAPPPFRDVAAGTNWLWRGVQQERANSMMFLGQLLLQGLVIPQDRAAGLELLNRAAALGHAPAQSFLADQAFTEPRGATVPEALRYYELAAQQHWPRAVASLGYLFMEGSHVPLNLRRGRDLLLRAAALEEPRAQYSCGLALLRGDWGVTNQNDALVFLRAAADQGVRAAQKACGDLLARPGTNYRSIAEAWKWYEIAKAGGDRDATAGMNALWKEMSSEQIQQAQREAAAFNPKRKGPSPYLTLPGLPPLQNPQTSPGTVPPYFTLPALPSLLDGFKTAAQ
jgi:TPR repeat protein